MYSCQRRFRETSKKSDKQKTFPHPYDSIVKYSWKLKSVALLFDGTWTRETP